MTIINGFEVAGEENLRFSMVDSRMNVYEELLGVYTISEMGICGGEFW